MRSRICGRCGSSFQRYGRADRRIWCTPCGAATADDALHAVVFEDMSGIHGLYDSPQAAHAAMREDAEAVGRSQLRLFKVIGQHGALSLLDSPNDALDRLEQAQEIADFERSQEMYR